MGWDKRRLGLESSIQLAILSRECTELKGEEEETGLAYIERRSGISAAVMGNKEKQKGCKDADKDIENS
ncbi:hypothetical protein PV327_008265 [Microctonus hyperodae]|uniref:Uncharacterized protein n=1 Tax=Microctonus hyperodae TaxID=165561 RepID=A0AA39KGV2_MICHY|nr:hypothetical protein PV327_008265 [Microctonus hyperodae]